MLFAVPASRAETREEWIALGARVHGGFGTFFPIGIRIGLDALNRLKVQPRDVAVIYYDCDKAPSACIADGIMIATTASPCQRTLQIASEKAPDGLLAAVVIRHRKTARLFATLCRRAGWRRSSTGTSRLIRPSAMTP